MTKKINITLLILSAFFANSMLAQPQNAQPPVDAQVKVDTQTNLEKADVSYLDALVLGLVEGVTEYLPISSTGHLIIANYFLGLESQTPLTDSKGNIIYSKKLDDAGKQMPFTMKEATDAYAIIIQIGAIFAVVIIYWSSLMKMLMGVLGKDKNGLLVLRNLIVAFLPAVVLGLLLKNYIEEYLFGILPVAIALFAGGLLMMFVQKKYDAHKTSTSENFDLHNLSIKQSLMIGLMQCVALWPGTSRSMMTILGGYLSGLKPSKAAEFSFLLGLITLSAASLYKIAKDGSNILQALSCGPLVLGLIVAFFSAAVSVKWLVKFLNTRGLVPFSYYRFMLAAFLIVLILANGM